MGSRTTGIIAFLLILFPCFPQEFHRQSISWGCSCAYRLNLPIQRLFSIRLRGGGDEKESSEAGISQKFEYFPLEAPADNLADLLDKDTEEEI